MMGMFPRRPNSWASIAHVFSKGPMKTNHHGYAGLLLYNRYVYVSKGGDLFVQVRQYVFFQ